jgi:pectate lyase
MNGGTTGGSGGTTVTVSTGKELLAAIEQAGSKPLTIQVEGTITTANTGAEAINIDGVHNISIIGAGDGAEFDGIGFHVKGGSSNLIFQNLEIHDVNSGPKDAIGIEGGSHNIWIDHNEMYSSMSVGKDYYDGLVDMKRGVEYVTISNNNFHDHHKVSLNGFSDSDEGGRYVTYDHNIFENIGSRAPSIRDGFAHVYDNYYKDIETSAINMRMGAEALIENNVFENVRDPIVSLDSDKIGFWNLAGNVFEGVTWGDVDGGDASAQDGKSTTDYKVPYDYKLDGTTSVKSYVLSSAGVGKLDVKAGTDTDVGTDATDVDVDSDSDTDTNAGATPPPKAGDLLTLTGRSAADVLNGGAEDDALNGLGGHDTLNGAAGNDTLLGGTNNDLLSGGAGNDRMEGGTGNDQLNGGEGTDTLTGGTGRDHFVFASVADSTVGSGRDVITDFAARDQIDLSGIDAQSGKGGDQDFTFLGSEDFTGEAGELHVIADGDFSVVEGDVNGDGSADFQIALAGHPSLSASDFIL